MQMLEVYYSTSQNLISDVLTGWCFEYDPWKTETWQCSLKPPGGVSPQQREDDHGRLHNDHSGCLQTTGLAPVEGGGGYREIYQGLCNSHDLQNAVFPGWSSQDAPPPPLSYLKSSESLKQSPPFSPCISHISGSQTRDVHLRLKNLLI